MNVSTIAKDVVRTLKKYSPEILTGIGVTGMITTTVMAVSVTPKAMKLIEERKKELKTDKISVGEAVKATWKVYLPCAITGATSAACIIGASSQNFRRNAALATAYTLSETALKDYKDKVIETIGEKAHEEIRDSIAKDKVDANPVTNTEVIITPKGETLCYDVLSGRYFKSDIETIRRSVNDLNRQLLQDDYISLNELYYALGLNTTTTGDQVGWAVSKGLIDLHFRSTLADDGTPCLVLDFNNPPQYSYNY